jgi:predicted RNA-binding Zn-ribbon protein involved in translation (DUF1610 family)
MATEPDLSLSRAMPLLGRAVRLRCPNCGSSGLWRTWFSMQTVGGDLHEARSRPTS